MSIKPCPFCGSTNISIHEGSTFRWRYAQCDDCGATSGEVRIETLGDKPREQREEEAGAMALEAWNTRVPAA